MKTLVPAKVVSEDVIPALELVEPRKVPGATGLRCPATPHRHSLQGTHSFGSLLGFSRYLSLTPLVYSIP